MTRSGAVSEPTWFPGWVEAAVRFSDRLRRLPIFSGFVGAERTAGLTLEVLLQAAVLREKRRPKLKHHLGSGLTPGFLRPFHTTVEELHRGLHVAAGPGQALLAITRVVHALPVAF